MMKVLTNISFFITIFSSLSQAYYDVIPGFVSFCGVTSQTGNLTLKRNGVKQFLVDADFDVSKYSKTLQSFLICERCTSRADSNCETILKMRSNNCCRIFDKEVPFWTSAFKATTPKFSCPLKKGHYQIRDAPLSIKDSIEPLLSGLDRIEDFYWKIKFQLFSNPDKEELYCVKGGGKIVSFKDS